MFLDIIQRYTLYERFDGICYQYVYPVDVHRLFVLRRLIQSHAQFGPASAYALGVETEILASILIQEFLNLFSRRIGYA